MSKILDTNECLELAERCSLPSYEEHRDALVTALNALATDIAEHLKLAKLDTTWEGMAFGGLRASFHGTGVKWRGKGVAETIRLFDGLDDGGDFMHPLGPDKEAK